MLFEKSRGIVEQHTRDVVIEINARWPYLKGHRVSANVHPIHRLSRIYLADSL